MRPARLASPHHTNTGHFDVDPLVASVPVGEDETRGRGTREGGETSLEVRHEAPLTAPAVLGAAERERWAWGGGESWWVEIIRARASRGRRRRPTPSLSPTSPSSPPLPPFLPDARGKHHGISPCAAERSGIGDEDVRASRHMKKFHRHPHQIRGGGGGWRGARGSAAGAVPTAAAVPGGRAPRAPAATVRALPADAGSKRGDAATNATDALRSISGAGWMVSWPGLTNQASHYSRARPPRRLPLFLV